MSEGSHLKGQSVADFMLHHINILADHVIAPYRAPDQTLGKETARRILIQLCSMHLRNDLALCISGPVSDYPDDLAKGRLVDATPTSDFGRLMQMAILDPSPVSLDDLDPAFNPTATSDAIANWHRQIIEPTIELVGFPSDIEIR